LPIPERIAGSSPGRNQKWWRGLSGQIGGGIISAIGQIGDDVARAVPMICYGTGRSGVASISMSREGIMGKNPWAIVLASALTNLKDLDLAMIKPMEEVIFVGSIGVKIQG